MTKYSVLWPKRGGGLPQHKNFSSIVKAAKFAKAKGRNADLFEGARLLRRSVIQKYARETTCVHTSPRHESDPVKRALRKPILRYLASIL